MLIAFALTAVFDFAIKYFVPRLWGGPGLALSLGGPSPSLVTGICDFYFALLFVLLYVVIARSGSLFVRGLKITAGAYLLWAIPVLLMWMSLPTASVVGEMQAVRTGSATPGAFVLGYFLNAFPPRVMLVRLLMEVVSMIALGLVVAAILTPEPDTASEGESKPSPLPSVSTTLIALLALGIATGVGFARRANTQWAVRESFAVNTAYNSMKLSSKDPELAVLLAVVAASTASVRDGRATIVAERALIDSLIKLELPSGRGSESIARRDTTETPFSFTISGLRERGSFSRIHASWHPDGKRLAVGEARIDIWDVDKREKLASGVIDPPWVNGGAWSPDGKWLASAGSNPDVVVWDTATWQARARFDVNERGSAVRDIEWCPDGQHFATASDDGGVRVWSASDGRLLVSCEEHEPEKGFTLYPRVVGARSVKWIDGDSLLSIGDNGQVKFCNTRDGGRAGEIRLCSPVVSMSRRQNGWAGGASWFFYGCENLLFSRIVNDQGPSSGAQIREVDSRIRRLEWDPTGRRLVVLGDRWARIWYPMPDDEPWIGNDQPWVELKRVRADISDVAWSHDGQRLAIADVAGDVQVYPLGLESLVRAAKQRVKRTLSASECLEHLRLSTLSPDASASTFRSLIGCQLK